jgi:hypothetical protein
MPMPARYLATKLTEEPPKPMFKTPWILATVETELSINHEHLRQAHARVLAARKSYEEAQQRIRASIVLIEHARIVSGQVAMTPITLPESAAGNQPAAPRSSTDGKLAGSV